MKRGPASILKHKKMIVIIFGVCTVVSGILSLGVGVNYNFADYLPKDASSTVALDKMYGEFTQGAPNARLVVEQQSIPKALHLKEKIAAVEGVNGVLWLDDVADVNTPKEMMKADSLEKYYKDNMACFMLTLDDMKAEEALKDLRQIAGKGAALSGSAVDKAIASETTGKEMGRIMFIVIPLCLLILLLTTTSWVEPLLLMLTIGIAIVINAGTNIMLGEISFITKAASSVLQLAVSMDYAIFLLYRFSEHRKEGMDAQEAMAKSMGTTFYTITACGLVTIMGFAALIFMKFRIGPDMGLVMAKAISISVISSLTLLPVLTLLTRKAIEKTRHRPFIPQLKTFSRGVFRLRVPVIILFLLLMIPAFLAQGSNTFNYGASQMFGVGTPPYLEQEKVEQNFGKMNQLILMVPTGDTAREETLSEAIQKIPHVTGVISYVDNVGAQIPPGYLDARTMETFASDNYSRMIITVNTNVEGDMAFKLVEDLRTTAKEYYGDEALLAGSSPTTYDIKQVTTTDMKVVNFIAIGAILLILLLTMRSLSLPVILVLVIETAIWINLSIPYFLGQHLQYIAYLIISSVQLGVTVDYAILMANRYSEERRLLPKKEAMLKTVEKSTLSILTSAAILTLGGFSLGFVSSTGVLQAQGILVGRGALLSTVMVIFVLPVLLYRLDGLIRKTTWKANFVKGGIDK